MRKDGLVITLQHKDDFLTEELTKQLLLRIDEEELKALKPEQSLNEEIREKIKTRFNYIYPYQNAAGLKIKMTVSELKKQGQFVDEEQSALLFPETVLSKEDAESRQLSAGEMGFALSKLEAGSSQEQEMTVPDFIRGSGKTTSGTDRGTLYHRVLELLNLSAVSTREKLMAELDRMVREKKLKSEEIKKLKLDYIFDFTQSPIAARMRKAQEDGKLYKEQQFVMGLRADEIMKDQAGDELVLIQGIIDVFFEENDELVLLDYKSDIVENEEQLVGRYRVQLEYYKRALEQILKKRVKEILIYSLYLGKEIKIN
jgi:ATP-dependent helicase/nuclease subunit A